MAKKAIAEKPPKPAKPKKGAAEPEAVKVTYHLADLPTAQHKAGLAGLLLQVTHMEKQPAKPPAIPKADPVTATSVTIEFTKESVQAVFDSVYAAEVVPARVKSKWNAPEVKPAEDVWEDTNEKGPDGKPVRKKVRYFFHEHLQPSGLVLRQYLINAPDDWLKLWRGMIWNIPRGNPQSRKPFEQCQAGKPCGEGADAWSDLVKYAQARDRNEFHTGEVAGSLWLGAQATNAEGVPFAGRVEQTLLLHFWPVAAQVYRPSVIGPDGGSEFVGYVLAIPEVADLKGFVADYPVLLAGLGGEVRGYVPAEAVIDVPAEAALSFLHHLAGEKAEGTEVQFSIGSVEFLHLDKRGNNVKTLAAGRLAPKPGLLREYVQVVGKPGEKHRPYGNPLFRRGLLLALVDGRPWYQPFGKLFAERDVSFFVPTDAPPKLSWFWSDARKKFQEVIHDMPDTPPNLDDPSATDDDVLAGTVNRLVRRYLDARLEKEKPEWDFSAFRKAHKTPPEAADARRKLAERLFLELRSRRDQAFVDHFTNTFFGVGQYLAHKPRPRMFELVAAALFGRPVDVKTLTLMALSANSYVPAKKKETPK